MVKPEDQLPRGSGHEDPAVTGDCQAEVSCTAKQLRIPRGTSDTMIAYRPAARQHCLVRSGQRPAGATLGCSISGAGGARPNLQDLCTRLSLAGTAFITDRAAL